MSQLALLTAARNRLRSELGLADAACDVQFDGKPPPIAGQLYVSVHAGEWRPGPNALGALDEEFGVDVTVTVRTARIPQGRQGALSIIGGETGLVLDRHLRLVTRELHMRYEVTGAANDLLVADGLDERHFFRSPPLVLVGTGRPTPRFADWFSADQDPGGPPVAVSQTVRFGKARRVQRLDDMEGAEGVLSLDFSDPRASMYLPLV